MPPSRSKARKRPLASTIPIPPPSISRTAAQARISEFHTSLKRKGPSEDAGQEIDHEALDAYQKLSQAGQGKQRGGDSSKVLVPWLQQCWDRSKQTRPKLR